MLLSANWRVPLRWRNVSTKRLLAIHFSPFNFLLHWQKNDYSPSIAAMGDGIGISVAFRLKVTLIILWISWWAN